MGNRRLQSIATIVALANIVGSALIFRWPQIPILVRTVAVTGTAILALAALMVLSVSIGARVARRGDQILLRLGSLRPLNLPLDSVECFFHGQAPSPCGLGADDSLRVNSLVVRIAERDKERQQGEVPSMFGKWCGGYITMNGLWCEPISLDQLNKLNRRLVKCKQGASGTSEDLRG